MSQSFTEEYKIRMANKALERPTDYTLKAFAGEYGIGYSTLQRWIRELRSGALGGLQCSKELLGDTVVKERRPQDWNAEERLNIVIQCASLDEEAISQLCREKGIYPHHVTQWKEDFATGRASQQVSQPQGNTRQMQSEIKLLKKELNRKDKALAEAAALLVLQKKVNAMWDDEDS